MDWTSCRKERLVKEIKIDKNLIESLLKSSQNKMDTQSTITLNDDTASSKVSLAYEALRELLEALAIQKGYKIYNHECYCAFLKEIMEESSLGDMFDKLRKVRNAINYYGKDISAEEATSTLNNIISLMKSVKDLFK